MASQELNTVISMLKERPAIADPTVEEMRAGLEVLGTVFPVASDVALDPVDAGGVPAEWVTAPGVAPERVVLYLHGGGYVVGSIRSHCELASRLSKAAAARVLLIGYRLAPEHPHPAAVEDATAAYRWLLKIGISPGRIVIAVTPPVAASRSPRSWHCAMPANRCPRLACASHHGSTWKESATR
jgi:monoterpene epsilon-lactone hydrolase